MIPRIQLVYQLATMEVEILADIATNSGKKEGIATQARNDSASDSLLKKNQ
ncbi:hypothetical protein [Flavobacterium dankookense]|uniref:Uncharacterized protein n=1 Tax=Flavobacterium dankookense TaxID=706186 RepID=A0A4R6Q972_9FLAO|nr:hypothetical protein [Flavobacterium dankookense]TDP58617.1 hypothetical protein BC748_1840 [Flavobacterium dankookense]